MPNNNLDPKFLLHLYDEDPVAFRTHLRSLIPTPTMADVEWDDDEHTGLCAEHPDSGLVRMTGRDSVGDIHYLYMGPSGIYKDWADPSELTPIPGTRVDLTPRLPEDDQAEPKAAAALPRPEDVPAGEIWMVSVDDIEMIGVRSREGAENAWGTMHPRLSRWGDYFNDSDITLLHRLVPETHPTVAHPRTLTTQEDYQGAPDGTVVATDGQWPWRKFDGEWWSKEGYGTSCALIALEGSRAVLRWGWEA